MRRELRNTFLFFISFSIAFLFGLMLLNDSKPVVIVDDTEKSPKENYDVFEVDSLVKLKNGSNWYVLKKNTNKDKMVTLISVEKINDSYVQDPNDFITNKYKDKLANSISVSSNTFNIRLLDSYDIISLYDTEVSLDNFDRSKFNLLSNNTIVNVLTNEVFNSLCNNSVCVSNNTDIRVVIEIPKFFVEEL